MAFGGITGRATTNWTNEEILSTATAQSLGLGAGATPDAAFEALVGRSVKFSRANIVTEITTMPFIPDIVFFQSIHYNQASAGDTISILAMPNKLYSLFVVRTSPPGGGTSCEIIWPNDNTISIINNFYANEVEYIAIKFS